MPLMTLARGCKSTFEGFRAALGLIKDARGLGSENPEQAKAITAALDQAEAGAKVAEAQIAKALGYELCKCQNRNRSQNDHGLAKHQTHSCAVDRATGHSARWRLLMRQTNLPVLASHKRKPYNS